MSNKNYYELWLKTKEQFAHVLAEDQRLQSFAEKPVGLAPQATAVEEVATVYCKYCELFNKLCDIYDQMQQPQRQKYLKLIIDALTCRILELKTMLQDVENFEYTYPERALEKMLMVPQDIQIMCPFFYPFEIRQKEMQYIMDEILNGNRLGDPTPTASQLELQETERLEAERIKQEEKDAEIKRKLALGEEILIEEEEVFIHPAEKERRRLEEEHNLHVSTIQRMERSRKVVKERLQKKFKDDNLYLELAGLKAPQAKEALRKRAAEFITKFYRTYKDLKREALKDLQLKLKLDMVINSYQPPSAKIRLEEVKERRRQFRRKYYEDWMARHVKEKARVFKLREGDIMQDITDEIREWWWEWYKDCRVFDEFPFPEEGGSILVVQGETFSTSEFIEWRINEEKRLKKEAANPKTKEDIKAEKQAEKEEKKRLAREAKEREKKLRADYRKQRLNPDTDPGIYINVGKNIKALQDAWNLYQNQWKDIDKPNPKLEVIKKYILDLIIEDVYKEIQLELRPIVDEIMRLELVQLKAALKLEYQLTDTPMSLIKKRKKPKKPKHPKPDKTIPARVFQVLADNNIVRKYPRVTLKDYWGDKNYAAADLRAIAWTPKFPQPCIGDVIEQVRIKCLLTLCSDCPNAVRSQLLVGPNKSGKKTLIYAVATETNSLLIDLSPMNIYNKLSGAKGLKKMLGYVNKVSRYMQPTIIMVDKVDKLFYKKVPKEEKEFDPTRLSKDFYKEIVKQIKKPDKIIVMGTASEPWIAKAQQMKKAFPEVLLIPRTDYGTIYFILTKLMMKYHSVSRDFNVNSLAQALRGFDIQSITKAVKEVMTGNRIAELAYKPLNPMEILNAVLSYEDSVYTNDEDFKVYQEWYLNYTPWGEKLNYYTFMLEKQLEHKLKNDKKKKKP